jgi:hypothetical protein
LLSFPFSWAVTKSQAVAGGGGRRARRGARPRRPSSVLPRATFPTLRSPSVTEEWTDGCVQYCSAATLPQRGQGPTSPLPSVLLHRRHSSPTQTRRRGVGRRGAAAPRSHGRGGEEQQWEATGEGPCSKSASSGSIFLSRKRHGAKWGRRLEHLLETFFR